MRRFDGCGRAARRCGDGRDDGDGAGTVARADAAAVPDGLVTFVNGWTYVVDAAVPGDRMTTAQVVQPDGSVTASVDWSAGSSGSTLRLAHVDALVAGDQDASAVLGRSVVCTSTRCRTTRRDA